MTFDIKTLSVSISLTAVIFTAAMWCGALQSRVKTIEVKIESGSTSNQKMAEDIMEIKSNIATLMERTKP